MGDEYLKNYIQKLAYMTGIPAMALEVILVRNNIGIPLNRAGRKKLSALVYKTYGTKMKIPQVIL